MSVDRARADVAVLPTYLLISHTEYDPATTFGHTGPVGGPYPGMVPGPQIPAYTG